MVRIGFGYDVHRLAAGRKLILGGVEIPSCNGLLGHSDADVLVHAVMDAMLGAAGLGDIGMHFPDSDPQYKDINSIILLQKVRDLLESKGYLCHNLDCTIVAESPKLAPYREAMQGMLSRVLRLEPNKVNIKATTTEGLGFAGKGEGIAVYAVCTINETALES